MLPIPPSRAPLLSLLEMYVRSSGSASDGRLLSISVRLRTTSERVSAETRRPANSGQELGSHSGTDGEWMEEADETQPSTSTTNTLSHATLRGPVRHPTLSFFYVGQLRLMRGGPFQSGWQLKGPRRKSVMWVRTAVSSTLSWICTGTHTKPQQGKPKKR